MNERALRHSNRRIGEVQNNRRRLTAFVVAAVTAAALLVGAFAAPAQAAVQRIMLRTLVVSSGDPATQAVVAELDRQAIPYTVVDPGAADRPVINEAFLVDGDAARFQAVVLPNQAGGGLSAEEMTALAAYEAAYAVRQVNGYDWPNPSMGLNYPNYSGTIDGAAVTITEQGLAGPFSYLTGTLTADDFDPAVTESYGYLADVDPALAQGRSFTPLVTASVNGGSGVLAGAYSHEGREELVITASFNQYMQWFNALAPGIVNWMTRGVYLGYQRNFLNVHIDDVLLPDSRWSVSGNCTPGDDCVDPEVTTTDIRMTDADVTRLVNWQNSSGIALDMVFNAGGAVTAGATDPLTTSLLQNKDRFRWINHTYSHQYLGCIQIAPTVAGQSWKCATQPDEQPRQDPAIAQQLSDGVYWAAPSALRSQVADNHAWAVQQNLPNYVREELVTGEHSGLASLPQMPTDNPFLADALAAEQIAVTASDASREPQSRSLTGGATVTLPRHPMNIYYNTATYQEQIDEYNWYYTSAANGGGGICENNPLSTCITPLPADTDAQARSSFETYLKPLEVRNALRYVLTHDPRPFYAHQSNLAEDGLLYPVLDGVIEGYRSAIDASKAPLVQTGMTQQHQALTRLASWRATGSSVDGYIDNQGVHVPDAAVEVPVTVPAGSNGSGLEAYAGSLSGWTSSAQTVQTPTPAAGYLVTTAQTAPGAPTSVTASAGAASATVSWQAPASDGGSPITGYQIEVRQGGQSVQTLQSEADSRTFTVADLTNGTDYQFSVAAVNAVGVGEAVLTETVTPAAAESTVPGVPSVEAGNGAISATWAKPASTTGITGYRVTATGGGSPVSTDVAADATVAAVTGLTNGTEYTVTVTSLLGEQTGDTSQASAAVTPQPGEQLAIAPALGSVSPSPNRLEVSWTAPTDAALGTPTGYQVRVYEEAGTAPVTEVNATGTSAVVSGLTNGTGYSAEVVAVYAGGAGPASARSAAATPVATVPDAPVIKNAQPGRFRLPIDAVAKWEAPAVDGGSPITGYVVTAYQINLLGQVISTTSSTVLPATARSHDMPLNLGRYYFTVVAINAVGTSASSAASNVVYSR